MTEDEWLTSTNRVPMLHEIAGKVRIRKLYLFMAACCRRVWRWIDDPRSRRAIEAIEQYVEGEIDREALAQARQAAECALGDDPTTTQPGWPSRAVFRRRMAALLATNPLRGRKSDALIVNEVADSAGALKRQEAEQCRLLRCIVGNPFRPVPLEPSWRTSTAVAMAQRIFAERRFELLPILADALEDAGCENGDVLTHCRGEGVHALGCWVVDLVLGKK
jgi:hypothetical protein